MTVWTAGSIMSKSRPGKMPIITICAMIMMMLMVNLLNLVFRWLPFFKICFPLPNLKAKGGAA